MKFEYEGLGLRGYEYCQTTRPSKVLLMNL